MLDVTDLAVWLPRRGTAVRSTSFACAPGTVLLLAAHNGEGSTCLLRALGGALPAGARVTGSARLDGDELLDLPRSERDGEVILVESDQPASDRRIREVLRGRGDRRGGGEAVAARLGLDVAAGCELRDLDAGLRMRVGLAAALARRPRLLLLDQVLARLESSWRDRVVALVREYADEGGTVVWAEHELTAATQATDEVYELGAGLPVQPLEQWRPRTLGWTPLQELAAELSTRPAPTVSALRAPLAAALRDGWQGALLPQPTRNRGTLPVRLSDREIVVPAEAPTLICCSDNATARAVYRELAVATGVRPVSLDQRAAVGHVARQADTDGGRPPGTTLRELRRDCPTLEPDRPVSAHAKGEQAQLRLALARAGQPRVLYEPQRFLDPDARQRLSARFAEDLRATLVVSTDVELASLIRRVVICSDAGVVADGSSDSVLPQLPVLPYLARVAAPRLLVARADLLALIRTGGDCG